MDENDGELYFAYGSNMDGAQMTARASSARLVAVACLRNYELVFNRQGSYRKGAVASVEPKEGGEVYGVVYALSKGDLVALDTIEDPHAYFRSVQHVFALNGKRYDCQLYRAFPQGTFKPDLEYLELIIAAAQARGLPSNYIRELESFRST